MPPPPGPNTPDSVVKIREWGGLVTNKDPHDLAPGEATVQINVVPIRPGELRVRGGAALVKFDT